MMSSSMNWCVDTFWGMQRETTAVLSRAVSIILRVPPLGPWGWFFVGMGGICVSVPLYYIIRYRSSIRKRVQEVELRLSTGLVYREVDDASAPSRKKLVRALELHPPFVEKSKKEGWKLMSLGQYLSTLRIINPLGHKDGGNCNDDDDPSAISKILERELEATIGAALLRNFGPRLGAVLLPMLGISQVDSWIGQVATSIASYVASHILVDVSSDWDPSEDRAAFPLAVSEIVAFANLNQKMRSNNSTRNNKKKDEPTTDESLSLSADTDAETTTAAMTPLDWMNRGEIGYSPSYYASATIDGDDDDDDDDDTAKNSNDDDSIELIPNPFVVERHFESAILGLEGRIRGQSAVTATNPSPNAEPLTTTAAYDPNDRSLPLPVPINERVLPGLHLGWGDAKCTHSKREILRNRLLAVLLTKLSYNYHLVEKNEHRNKQEEGDVPAVVELFTVMYEGTLCRFPDEFVQALLDNGHTIEVCPRSTITTFGMAACVKEDDGDWTNIPIAFFFLTGYEQKDGKPAYFAAPHGGLDLSITSGPLLGKDGNSCDVQFYVAIEGLCGWHSNHNADVPWVKAVSTTNIYNNEQSLQSVRMAGLLAVTFNALATEMNLPFGGYGVLGVCNDSAAFVDFAVRGETNLYPLISTGRFLFHSGRRLLELKDSLSRRPDLGLGLADEDLRRLVAAACQMDSDIHNSPSQLIGATRRYLANSPTSYFQLTEDSKNMMSAVAKIYQEYVEFGGDSQATNFVNFLFQKKKNAK